MLSPFNDDTSTGVWGGPGAVRPAGSTLQASTAVVGIDQTRQHPPTSLWWRSSGYDSMTAEEHDPRSTQIANSQMQRGQTGVNLQSGPIQPRIDGKQKVNLVQ